ncbi:MAG: large conductance mechanosensitive channel protein MscL [Oscillospiraceae bacterium]|nr:large conductance mechanosensitive channel protein MscL [Oscillospiraceae bacterium]
MKKIAEEFKAFIMRGNVLDMAVGVIIGGAFGKITSSLVNDVFMPFLGFIFGSRDMTALNVIIREAELGESGEVVKEAITLGFGTFVGAIIDFILIALVVFGIVKTFNKVREKAEAKKKAEEEAAKKAEEEAKANEPKAPTTEELLASILEELKAKK